MRKRSCRCSGCSPARRCWRSPHDLRYPDLAALYAAVGENHVSAQNVVEKLVESRRAGRSDEEDIAEATVADPGAAAAARTGDPGVVGRGRRRRVGAAVQVLHPRARATRSSGSSPGATGLGAPRRLRQRRTPSNPSPTVWSRWNGRPRENSMFLVAIQVEALDRTRLLSDITRVLSDQHVNILSATVQTNRDRVALSRFTFEMADPKHLGHVLKAVRSVDGVYDVYRVRN